MFRTHDVTTIWQPSHTARKGVIWRDKERDKTICEEKGGGEQQKSHSLS